MKTVKSFIYFLSIIVALKRSDKDCHFNWIIFLIENVPNRDKMRLKKAKI